MTPVPLNPSVHSSRIHSIDVIRGVVMMLMALDHVRVYSGLPAGGPEVGIFLTRWVTHFCAPAFLFLAGASAYLAMQRTGRAAMASGLFWRGLWLVLLELTLVRSAWTFNLEFHTYLLAGILWAIGWSMILMAALIFLPRAALGMLSLMVIGLHNQIGALYFPGSPWAESFPWFWRVLYTGGPIDSGLGGHTLLILYSIVPWVAVMAAGFVFAPVLHFERERRARICILTGLGLLLGFILLRSVDGYGDPRPRSSLDAWPAWIAFLNVSKYPASLSYLLMTLGPIIALMPLLENLNGRFSRVVVQFGRVPLFFYLLHIPLIHGLALGLAWIRSPAAIPWMFDDHPLAYGKPPEGYTYSLALLYGMTAIVLVLLFFACRWYALKRSKLPRVLGRFL